MPAFAGMTNLFYAEYLKCTTAAFFPLQFYTRSSIVKSNASNGGGNYEESLELGGFINAEK